MPKLIVCSNCGHTIGAHIYGEGACRPGEVCVSNCKKFVQLDLTPEEALKEAQKRWGNGVTVKCYSEFGQIRYEVIGFKNGNVGWGNSFRAAFKMADSRKPR